MPRPIKFLQVTTFYPPHSFGGDAVYVHRLSQALADQGHEVDVVHCVDSFRLAGTPEGPPSPEHPRVTVHSLRSPYGVLSPLLSHQSGRPWLKDRSLGELFRQRRFDVIHFHNISLFGPRVLDAGGRDAVKLYTTHEYWLVCPTHVLWKFDRELCRRPQCLGCVLRAGRPPQLWRYTNLLSNSARSVDQFVAPSRFTAELHAERGFDRPFEYLPNFCDRADADWRDPGARPNPRPYFLYVGRLETIKGLQTLIPSWRRVDGFDLLVAGCGTLDQEMRALADGIPGVRFLGHVRQPDIGRFYAHARALIVPSLTYEVFALVTVEALARKTPIIARDLGGLTEVVADSGGGLTYRDEAGLIECVHTLGPDSDVRSELAESGYRYYTAYLTREAHLNRYLEIVRNAACAKFGRIPWEAQ